MDKRRVTAIALLVCLCLVWLPGPAWAASTADAKEPISPGRDCSLTIAYRYDGKSVSDHPVKLYKIADVSADFQYSLTAPFAGSGLELNGVQSSGEWNVIRSTLETHILAYGVDADLSAATDQDGQVSFRGLKPGLYLAITEPALKDDWIYVFESALVALPGLGDDGLWQYEVEAAAKPEAIPPVEGDEEIEFKVLKLWRGDHGRADRPESIEVEIFCDGESYQTVILSEENHWAYSWQARNDGSVWKVVERNVPSGYTMTIEERDTSFVLTNTRPPENPDSPSTGDTANIMLHFILMMISGCMLIILGIAGKRKRL